MFGPNTRCWTTLLMLCSPMAIADCRDDTECYANTRCLVAAGYPNRCATAILPRSEPGEAQRFSVPLAQRGETGYRCQFNVDCLPGFACYKTGEGGIEGECLKWSSADTVSP